MFRDGFLPASTPTAVCQKLLWFAFALIVLMRFLQLPLLLIAGIVLLPILAVFAAVLQWNDISAQILAEMASTVLPRYAMTSIALCAMVAFGVAVSGVATACAVTLFDIPKFSLWDRPMHCGNLTIKS